MLEALPSKCITVTRHLPRHWTVNPVKVGNLLPEKKDSLLLQGGLYLCQADQGACHLQISRYLGDAVAGDLVGFLGNSAAAAFYLLCRPGQDMPNQIFPV